LQPPLGVRMYYNKCRLQYLYVIQYLQFVSDFQCKIPVSGYFLCGHRHTQFGNILTPCRRVADMSPTFPAKDKVFRVVPRAVCGHLELHPIRKFNLDLFRFLLLEKISRENIRDGRPNRRRALLALGVLEAFRRGLEVGTHGVLPEQSLQQESLE
jgi:hypothetical protein